MFGLRCGAQLPASVTYCSGCGATVESSGPKAAPGGAPGSSTPAWTPPTGSDLSTDANPTTVAKGFRTGSLEPGTVVRAAYIASLRAKRRVALVVAGVAVSQLTTYLWLPDGTTHSRLEIAVISILNLSIQSLLWCSLLRRAVSIVRGVPLSALPTLPVAFLRTALVGLVALVPVAFGLLLLVVPGIILGIAWSQAMPLLAEGRFRGLGALKESARLTKGDRGAIFVVGFAVGLIALPGRVIDTIAEHTELLTGALGGLVLICAWLWQLLVVALFTFSTVVVYDFLLRRDAEKPQQGLFARAVL